MQKIFSYLLVLFVRLSPNKLESCLSLEAIKSGGKFHRCSVNFKRESVYTPRAQ